MQKKKIFKLVANIQFTAEIIMPGLSVLLRFHSVLSCPDANYPHHVVLEVFIP
jgi:hypothetical protein